MIQSKENVGLIDTNGEIVLSDVFGMSIGVISLRGTFTGTLQFEATVDGTTWFALNSTPLTSGAAVTSATAVGQWSIVVAGLKNIRVRASATITGEVQVVTRVIANGTDLSVSNLIGQISQLPNFTSKRITFDGGTSNAIGDKDGSLAVFPIFTVTGDVMVWVFGICKTDLVGAGTLEVGVVGNTAVLLAQITDATTLDANEVHGTATPTLGLGVDFKAHIIGGGLDINGKVTTTDITAGVVDYYVFWRALSADGSVVAA